METYSPHDLLEDAFRSLGESFQRLRRVDEGFAGGREVGREVEEGVGFEAGGLPSLGLEVVVELPGLDQGFFCQRGEGRHCFSQRTSITVS